MKGHSMDCGVREAFVELFEEVLCRATVPSHKYHEMSDHRSKNDDTATTSDDAYDMMPVATPVSPCSTSASGDVSASPSEAETSIAGNCDGRSELERKYRVDSDILGEGHYGSVRICVDRATGRRCAVKSVRKRDRSTRTGGVAREIVFLREVRHPRVVGLVDAFEDSDHVHIVTELCAGGELYHRIVRKKSDKGSGSVCFAERDAARIVREVLKAVSHLHERGIAHRDIKPENILFETNDDDSPIKIIDFGLARTHVEGVEPPMSAVVGTPYYIAPEVLRRQYRKSCDLWSVGVVAYILLCGYPPFNGANGEETHRRVLRGRYGFPSRHWRGVSPEAIDFVRGLLQMDTGKRMTAEEALGHPWMAMHGRSDEPKESPRQSRSQGRSSMFGGLANRRIRKAKLSVPLR